MIAESAWSLTTKLLAGSRETYVSNSPDSREIIPQNPLQSARTANCAEPSQCRVEACLATKSANPETGPHRALTPGPKTGSPSGKGTPVLLTPLSVCHRKGR